MNPRVILRGLLLIATLIGLGYLLEITQFGATLNEAWIDSEVRGKGLSGEVLFIAAGGLFTALGLPRQAVAFLGGYAFGFISGGALALLAALFGCVSAFYYARLLGRNFVAARFPRRIKKLDAFLRGHPFSMALLIRLLPVGSNAATNLVAGVSSVRGLPFFAGSALGYIPQTAVFALIGSGIQLDPTLRISVGVALFLISGILGVWLYRKYRHGKTPDEEIERALNRANGD
ncbi:MAG: TVP38/TMEM64 family protein [Gammaproteobacteria bacterium]|nr:MAG: TVP38/TMEM64 family protein [Gammaproteobacteria bacterium]